MRIASAVLFLVTLASLGLAAPPETRQHFGVTAHGNRFEVTRIDSSSEVLSRYLVLIADKATGKNYRLEAVRDFPAQTFVFRLASLQSPGDFVEAHFKLPFKGKTRSETRDEAAGAASSDLPVVVTLIAKGVQITNTEAEWHTSSLSTAKASLIAALPSEFVTVIDRLQAVAVVPPLAEFCPDLLGYFATKPSCRPVAGVSMVTLPPDCDFDRRLGASCSQAQVEQAAAIRKKHAGRWY